MFSVPMRNRTAIVDNNFFVSISDFDIMCKAVRYGTPLGEFRCHKIETETEGYQHQVSDFVEGVETDDNGSCMD